MGYNGFVKEKELMTNTCKECKFYAQHYILTKNSGFTKVECGHCKRPMQNGKYRRADKICEEFSLQTAENVKKEKVQTVTMSIKSIEQKLQQVLDFIQN